MNAPANASAAKPEYDYLFKMLVVGDTGVGKSSLLLRFSDDTFTESIISTIGVDFRIRIIHVRAKKIKLQIWDTVDQQYRYNSQPSSLYRGAHGVMIIYDVTNPETFNNVKRWLQLIERYACESVVKIVIGTKSDLLSSKKVEDQDVAELAEQFNMKFIVTSAKDNVNVDEAFVTLATDILEKKFKDTPELSSTTSSTLKPSNDKKCIFQ